MNLFFLFFLCFIFIIWFGFLIRCRILYTRENLYYNIFRLVRDSENVLDVSSSLTNYYNPSVVRMRESLKTLF